MLLPCRRRDAVATTSTIENLNDNGSYYENRVWREMKEEVKDPGSACAVCWRGQPLAFCDYIGKSQVSHVKLAQDAKEPPRQ